MKNVLRILLLLAIIFTNYQLFAKSSSENEPQLNKHLVSDNSIPLLKIIENTKSSTTAETVLSEIQILRIEFRVSNGASRSFVIGFAEGTTDGFDYGYDGGL